MSVLAVFMLMAASSAWADADAVITQISNYGLSATGTGTPEDPIVVTGIKTDAPAPGNGGLVLDIAGLTIDWQATSTVAENQAEGRDGRMVLVRGNGMLKITGGTTTLPTPDPNIQGDEIVAFGILGNVKVEFSGGTITGTNYRHVGIDAEGWGGTNIELKVSGGTINTPNGEAITVDWNDTSVVNLIIEGNPTINGLVTEWDGTSKSATVQVLGQANITQSWPPDPDDGEGIDSFNMTVASGATLTITETGSLTIPANGTLTIYGTVTNRDQIINKGTINNYGNTIDNQGTLTNNGTINNAAAGKITNSGTINNTGTIINEGKIEGSGSIDNKGTIKSNSEVPGLTPGSNPVKELDSDNDSNGGGCNAGFGLFGLLPLAVWVARKRMTA
jgi:hypothetical protein